MDNLENFRKKYQIITSIALATLVIGTVFYHYIEGLRWIDAVYFSVITLTTIGYGDISPKTDIGKVFTILYALAGISIIAAFARSLLERAADRRSKRQRKNN